MLRVLPPTNQTCLATIQVVAGWEKSCEGKQRVVYFLQQNLYMLRVLPARQTCFAASDPRPVYGLTPA